MQGDNITQRKNVQEKTMRSSSRMVNQLIDKNQVIKRDKINLLAHDDFSGVLFMLEFELIILVTSFTWGMLF